MTRSAQTDEELRWARRLLDSLPACRAWSIAAGSPPEPDVLATGQDVSVGIELREVIGFAELRRRESEADRVLTLACTILDSESSQRSELRVYFKPGWAPLKRDRGAHARSLASLVRAYMPANEGDTDVGEHSSTGLELDHSFVSYLSILRVDSLPSSESAPLHFWWGAPASPELIQRNIDAKAAKRPLYRGSYSQIWLLLHSSGASPSSGFDVSPDLQEHRFASAFDRVFLLAGASSRLLELRLEAYADGAPAV